MTGNAGEYSATGINANNPGYRQFFQVSSIPNPSEIFLFIEEHPDSINDGYFLNKLESDRWLDLPASYHNRSGNLTFADGHAESRVWQYPTTRRPARPYGAELPFRIPPGQRGDFDWLMQRTSIE